MGIDLTSVGIKNALWIPEDGWEKINPTVVITTDGKTTTATLREGKKIIKTGKAVCADSDEFDFMTGAEIAFTRLVCNRTEDKPAYREVRRQAKPGEYIKLTGDSGYTFAKKNQIVRVLGCPSPHVISALGSEFGYDEPYDGKGWFFSNHEYVVLEGYTPPEPPKPKYLNGKFVKIPDSDGANLSGFTNGKVYECKDGWFVDDRGNERPSNACSEVPIPAGKPDHWFLKNSFIPFVED